VTTRRGVPSTVGELTAAIGYELVEGTLRERRALKDAGYHLPAAGQKDNSLARLLAALQATKSTQPRRPGRPRRHLSPVKHSAARVTRN
jgi:hypothetical protein